MRRSHPPDLVEALSVLNAKETADLLMTLEPQLRAESFAHFPATRQDILLRALPSEAVAELIERMPADDRADLFNRLSEEARAQLLPALA